AGLFTLFARTDAGVTAFLVPADAPGLSVGPRDRKMGQRGAHTADVLLTDCRIPADALLGTEGRGFAIAMQTLDRGRITIAAVCVAIAERLIDDALAYALERNQFGTRIADFQLVQAMLADSRAEAYAARAMVADAARRLDARETVAAEASCAKLFASEMVGRVADRAVQVHGGAGYIADYGIERFYRDVRLFRLYEGTSEIQRLVIARGMIAAAEGGG
ncbi:MAG: acyl-CoA dehydrogenase family protein, partial [Pseudomonadota bacterium]